MGQYGFAIAKTGILDFKNTHLFNLNEFTLKYILDFSLHISKSFIPLSQIVFIGNKF